MTQVALAEKPFEVAVAEVANSFAAQRGSLSTVALRVGLMALLTVVAIDERAGGGCFGLAAEGVDADVIPGRNVLPVRGGGCCEGKRRAEHDEEKCKTGTDHRLPPYVCQ